MPGVDARMLPPCTSVPDLTVLIYELLDAHADTAELAAGYQREERWAAHLEYLRSLQRLGRSVVAQMATNQTIPEQH